MNKLPAMSRLARVAVLGLVLSALGGLGLVTLASAQPMPAGAMPAGAPPMPHGPGMGLVGLPMGGPPLDHLLTEVKASDSQREKVHKILEAARQDMKAQHEAGRADHKQMLALFTASTVDASAVEALRQQAAARFDAASRRMTAAMVDAANVLSPEQRRQMVQLMERRHERIGERPPSGGEPGAGATR